MSASKKIDALVATENEATIKDFPAMPPDTSSMIDRLDAQYPHRCKRRNESEEFHQRYAGKRDLIDLLLMWRENERNGVYESQATDN